MTSKEQAYALVKLERMVNTLTRSPRNKKTLRSIVSYCNLLGKRKLNVRSQYCLSYFECRLEIYSERYNAHLKLFNSNKI